jgi:hypothetical protein
MGRVSKRLKTGDKPAAEAVKVKVKVESDDFNEEEESLDNDNDEEEEEEGQEEHVTQLVARVKRPGYIPLRPYVPPRPNYILVDYDVNMGDGVIPNDKVIRPMNCWLVLHETQPCALGREQHRQMSGLWSVSGMLQQRTYRKAPPHMYEQGRDIRMYVDNTKKQQR